MAETPKEIPITLKPEVDWNKVKQGPLHVLEPGEFLQYIPPIMSTVCCGFCGWEASIPDSEAIERMHSEHNCNVLSLPAPRRTWHESAAAFCFMIAVDNGWRPWMN